MVETPAKLGSVLSILNQKYSLNLKRQNILILVNGIEANALSNLETVINTGDQIVILPMFHGG
jgi:molybdopterin converting factor small subunit